MHERSLVKQLIEQIEEELHSRHLAGLTAVHLEIGEFAGVEPSLIELAFQEMAIDYWQTQVHLDLKIIPLTAHCQSCNKDFHVERFRFVCPFCSQTAVNVIAGESMQLVSLSVATSKTTESMA